MWQAVYTATEASGAAMLLRQPCKNCTFLCDSIGQDTSLSSNSLLVRA